MHIRRQKHSRKEISLIPLINIIFLLLIFFMIAGNIQRMELLEITPPTASGEEKRHLPIIISLDKKGVIALNSNKVQEEDLPLLLETAFTDTPNPSVTIRADKAASASRLVWLMNRIQEAGASDISIVTSK